MTKLAEGSSMKVVKGRGMLRVMVEVSLGEAT